MDAKQVGRDGEAFAAAWLADRGYDVLERNWRCPRGELDIVAVDRSTGELVAVEVKTRTGLGYGYPAEAVGREKLVRLHVLVGEYTRAVLGSLRPAHRVDVLALVWPGGRSAPSSIDHYVGVAP